VSAVSEYLYKNPFRVLLYIVDLLKVEKSVLIATVPPRPTAIIVLDTLSTPKNVPNPVVPVSFQDTASEDVLIPDVVPAATNTPE